ncbi:hypothetical protein PTSG_10967 [Salpingoeca rosetta]|uniref:Uncharacterized protein n=1 Tax=Salpingoeca rosetta (strain ATCC 50818 / BSB-021) TaxID=946362 RepID=F2USB5_SALR5|nr:uncharacterized protein PTSG_10967 [Salpingoeca rosetta]EGD81024.1 hypothetical protein PTSG_10967 [Salpingoeca rosetta]|eukprot:XP_004987894.1 hypothetical protein PTSG_10967 [Salpingoeca rosetta]
MDVDAGNNGDLGTAAALGAAGGSGFVLAYLLVALLFALPCSVPCLDATMKCIGCEGCPDDCCAGPHEDEEEEELIHTHKAHEKQQHDNRGYRPLLGVNGSGGVDDDEEVQFERVRYLSNASSYRLHERLLDNSAPVVSQTQQHVPMNEQPDEMPGTASSSSVAPPPPPPLSRPPAPIVTVEPADGGDDDYRAGSHVDMESDGVGHSHDSDGDGDSGGGGGGGGHFGTFLILVELLASIPESLLLAVALSEGKTPSAILASVIILNFAAGFAMFVDLIRPAATSGKAYGRRGHKESRIHQLMFIATSAAAGMLIFSVAAEVYVEFEETDPDCQRVESYTPMLELFAGTAFGAFLVILLVWVSGSRYAHRYKDKLMRALSRLRRRSSPSSSSSSSSSSSVCSLSNAYIKALLLVLFLSLWLFMLTIFGFLIFSNSSGGNHNFTEGVGGGAFLFTIGGTLIPEAQKASRLTGWSSLRKEIISAVTFLVGFLAAVVVVVLAEEDHVCIPKNAVVTTTAAP